MLSSSQSSKIRMVDLIVSLHGHLVLVYAQLILCHLYNGSCEIAAESACQVCVWPQNGMNEAVCGKALLEAEQA